MPVDEQILETTYEAINAKLQEISIERQKLKQLQNDAKSICLVDKPDPTVENPRKTKKVQPKDQVIGSDMTPARRNEIYDSIMSRKTAFGL